MQTSDDDYLERGVSLGLTSQHSPQKPGKRTASPRKPKQNPAARLAQSKFGGLVRALHTLGVYDKARAALTQIEKAIKDAST